MWQSLIDFISSGQAPYVFSGIIALVFLIALIDGWTRLSSTNQAIDRGIAILQSAPSRTSFFQQFEALADQFSRQPMFAAAWAEFCKTVILDKEREVVLTTRRPQEFFHEGSLLAPRINLRLYQAIPGYLISLGLFFTFIGLVAAIDIAANAMGKHADVSETQSALTGLLQVSSVKFISSVAGISLSIILSFIQKTMLNGSSRMVHRFNETLESLTQLVTHEQLLHQWLLAQEQTTRGLVHMANDIASEVTMNLQAQPPA